MKLFAHLRTDWITGGIFAVAFFVTCPSLLFAQGRGPAAVVVFEAFRDTVHPTQEFVGTVMPEKRALIGSAVDGRIVEFPLNEGDRVEEKGMLAQLLTETIKKEIEAAEAELKLRQDELRELQNGSLPEEREQAAAEVSVAEAAKTLAQQNFDRLEKLQRTANAASEGDLDQARAQLIQTKATFKLKTAAKQLAEKPAREEKIAQAEARIAMQQAVTDKLKDQLTKHTIISRFAGYISSEHTEIGAWVNRGGPVAEVVALDRVHVLAHALELYVPFIKRGMEVDVRIPSLDNVADAPKTEAGKPQPFPGEIVHIVPEADPRSRTFPVKVQVNNIIRDDGTPLINSGTIARVNLPTGPSKDCLLIPKDALVLSGTRASVWVVDLDPKSDGKQGQVRMLPVQKGIESGMLVEAISDQLTTGMLVVVEGNERLQPGAAVNILDTMPPPPRAVREKTQETEQAAD
ncbi:MAG: efflux RND transporter periplasmic adaptor subunit [Planctomycetaceae bacterium]|nr:efflux RND transporter periplasmic adaptor subunit [Planctomycetaceae bacterium]